MVSSKSIMLRALLRGLFLGTCIGASVWWVDFKWVLVKIGYIVQMDGCFFKRLNSENMTHHQMRSERFDGKHVNELGIKQMYSFKQWKGFSFVNVFRGRCSTTPPVAPLQLAPLFPSLHFLPAREAMVKK